MDHPDYRKRYLAEFLLKVEDQNPFHLSATFTKALKLKSEHTRNELTKMLLDLQRQLDDRKISHSEANGKMIPIIGALIA